MDLRDKLKILSPEFGLGQTKGHNLEKPELSQVIHGEDVSNRYGSFFRSVSTYTAVHQHGKIGLTTDQEIDPNIYRFVGKDDSLVNFDIRRALFLDTETTGLAGGTGTVPFLVGLGYFTESGFRVEQLFMRDYDEERSLLESLKDRFQGFDSLVSYNGKSFDMNLIQTRFMLSRMENPAIDYPHLDLLFTSRRIWRRRIGDCSLSSIERSVLGFKREGDVPGFLIPSLYFEYLRTGNGQPLASVFLHNRWDVVSLAALTILTGQLFSDPSRIIEHPLDLLSLGRTFENMFQFKEASDCYRLALNGCLSSEEREEILTLLGYVLKRMETWNEAVHIWETMTKKSSYLLSPYEELAKYYEHKARNFSKAIEVVNQALDKISLLEDLRPEYRLEMDRKDLEYRLRRLKRKLTI